MMERIVHWVTRLSESRYRFIYLFLFALSVRLCSFFVDYFYPDMIVSVLYRNGLNGGWEQITHKGLVYTWFLDISFAIFGDNARALNISAFFLTFIEGLLVYRLARVVGYNKNIGYVGALIFIITSSTSFPEMIVPNGEQVYSLFFLAGFICFVKLYFEKKIFYAVGLIASIWLAIKTKETGIWLPLTLLFCVYVDIIKQVFKTRKSLFIAVFGVMFLGLLCVILLFTLAVHYNIDSLHWLAKAWDYIRVYPKFNPVKLIALSFLFVAHPFFFLFSLSTFRQQLINNNFKRKEIFLYAVVFCLFLSGFAGGTRLYPHYFFPLYPLLGIFCAVFIYHYADYKSIYFRKILGLSLYQFSIMMTLYIFWALMVNPLKDFYGEKYPELTPNSYSVYLYPNRMERKALAFLEKEKEKNPKLEIYIWPIGHVMGYFSKLPFKIGPYIDVADNACMLYQSVEECAINRVKSFWKLNKTGDIFVEYRGILKVDTFSSNPAKRFFQEGFSSHQNLFSKTEQFAIAIDKEMEKRGAMKVFQEKNAMYLWKKP